MLVRKRKFQPCSRAYHAYLDDSRSKQEALNKAGYGWASRRGQTGALEALTIDRGAARRGGSDE